MPDLGALAGYCPDSPFLQAVGCVMLWSVPAQEVSQASHHLCHAKLEMSSDVLSACQSVCAFIPSNSFHCVCVCVCVCVRMCVCVCVCVGVCVS